MPEKQNPEKQPKSPQTPKNGGLLSIVASNLFKKPLKEAEKFWATLGPGFTTGAADDDPSGIATYSQTGARYGLKFLWLAPFSFPLMAVVQEMCARIGLVTGRGLAGNIRRHYPRWFLYTTTFLLFFANSFNIGADLGAMAATTQLILPRLDFNFLIIFFVVLSLGLQIFTSYKTYSKYLKWLALILLAYVITGLSLDLNPLEILKSSLIPNMQFSKEQILLVCAILGTTISPYLFFWQTSQEVEEEILEGKTTLKLRQNETTIPEIKKMRRDVWWGMFFSNLIMFFIILTTGTVLFKNGVTNITTAAQAAAALKPLAGNYASLLFSIGVIGTGLLAVPILAGSSSYALSEAFGWRQGLYRKLKQAKYFYTVIIVAMVIGLGINFLKIDPIKALLYSAVINGLVAPFILIPIVQISDNPKIMSSWVNNHAASVLGWTITIIMMVVAVATVGALLF